MTTPTPPPQQQQQQQQRPAASMHGHALASGLPVLHCEHGEDTEVLLAAPQLSALPQLEPLALEVGGPPPPKEAARSLPPPSSQEVARSLPPLPRSPPPRPQDDVAGMEEDVEDVAAVMLSMGGGGGPGGPIRKEGEEESGGGGATMAPQHQHEPVTPAARKPHAPKFEAAAASSPVPLAAPRELPATPPSSPVQERLLDESEEKQRQQLQQQQQQQQQQQLQQRGVGIGLGGGIMYPPHLRPKQQQMQPPAWQAASAGRVASARPGIFVADEPAPGAGPAWMSGWPVSPDQLLLLARDAVATGVHESPLLARGGEDGGGEDEFSFTAPFVGPLSRDAFRSTMFEIDLDDAFDLDPRCYGFRIDPLEAGRVWFLTRPIARFVRPLRVGGPLLPPLQPTGGAAIFPPQIASLKFAPLPGGGGGGGSGADHDLPPVRVVEFTYGYCADRRQGNTGGLGGAFGILFWANRPMPFPEGRPWESSWQQRVFNRFGPPGRAVAWLLDRALSAVWPWGAPVATARGAP